MLYTIKLMLQDLIAIEYVVELHVRKFGRLALLIEHIFFFFFLTRLIQELLDPITSIF